MWSGGMFVRSVQRLLRWVCVIFTFVFWVLVCALSCEYCFGCVIFTLVFWVLPVLSFDHRGIAP